MDKNNSIAPSKEITGNAEIDEKIAEWLRLDKVENLISRFNSRCRLVYWVEMDGIFERNNALSEFLHSMKTLGIG